MDTVATDSYLLTANTSREISQDRYVGVLLNETISKIHPMVDFMVDHFQEISKDVIIEADYGGFHGFEWILSVDQ